MIIGDVGGCLDQLSSAVADTLEDPDAVVIQVGDLVDRGPDSAGVLAFVRRRLAEHPRRWIQLIGNHESQYLGGAAFWPHRLGVLSREVGRRGPPAHLVAEGMAARGGGRPYR